MKTNFARQPIHKDFHIDFTSKIDGKRYFGKFTCKKLSVMDLVQYGTRKSQLANNLYFDPNNPGHGIDSNTDVLVSRIAHLELALVSSPAWWNLSEMVDSNLLSLVYKEVYSFENSFHGNEGNDASSSSEGHSQAEAQESLESGSPRPVVGSKVQAALEP